MQDLEIMVIEDNDTMRLGVVETLKRQNWQVTEFDNGTDALARIKKSKPHIVITDLKMEPMDGIEVLKSVKEISSDIEILLISAYGSVEVAVKAMQKGAADFLTKPFSPEELRARVNKIIEKMQQRENLELLKAEKQFLQDQYEAHYEDMVGQSQVMQSIFAIIERIAAQDSTVLIEGESGTGKELVARAIHRRSSRTGKPFIKINCGALNENLLESELFGHEKGSFTGAVRQKRGRFELAHNGTLFLDEIGDISGNMQLKLLQVIQEQKFERVGGENTIEVDVRFISATNKSLKKLVAEGKFRDDLFYRISVIPLQIPSLRERREDIPLLAKHFLEKLLQERSGPGRYFTQEGIRLLQNYHWPGNIRELENLIERLMVISPSEEITPQLISHHLGESVLSSAPRISEKLNEAVYTYEKRFIQDALKKSGGIKHRAAKLLGIRTSTLYYKMEKFGL